MFDKINKKSIKIHCIVNVSTTSIDNVYSKIAFETMQKIQYCFTCKMLILRKLILTTIQQMNDLIILNQFRIIEKTLINNNNNEFFTTNFVDFVIKHCRKKSRMTNCNK